MFESLQNGLAQAFRTLTGQARLSESNMREGLQLVERALLEADVNFRVVRDFMARVSQQALGEEVLRSLRPTQLVIKIVYDELVRLMGPVDTSLHLQGDFTRFMLCGLQGSGKTTTCAKLARLIKGTGRNVWMIAADLQRPAAIQQLQVLGQQIGVPVVADLEAKDPVALCQRGVQQARAAGANVVIIDTAGRLHIDEELMQQLRLIDQRVQPHQVYLVVDGMTGQDAVNSAKAFNEALELNGVIMTKLDGDQRGGAVLSVKAVTGVPIKFLGTGEHLEDLEPFVPEGMAQRILGQGDLAEIARRASQAITEEERRRTEEALARGQFTLEQFRDLLMQARRMGTFSKLLSLLPGMGAMREMMQGIDAERDISRIRGIIDSMTPDERRNPRIIDPSRRRRIAAGAGVETSEVSDLVKQFDGVRDMMEKMATMSARERLQAVRQLQQQAVSNPQGMLTREKKGTGKRLTNEQKARLRKKREKEIRRARKQQKHK
jgi:signal recognition particle subunit SRP54